jgi:hypothetical protein
MWRDNLRSHRRVLQWVKKHARAGETFATCLIGHTGYYTDLRVIDVCGVLDPVVAHRQVKNFGKGQAGHEKIAQADYIFAKRPTYIGLRILHGDLYRRGYFLDGNVPERTFDGVWTRDTLPERGHRLEGTRIGFDSGTEVGWTVRGNSFSEFPSFRHHPGQGEILGAWGGFANSFHPTLGTKTVGLIASPPIVLRGDLFVFRMAGGRDEVRLTASLMIDERPVFRTTGHNGDMMSRREWDIRPYRGKVATFEVSDQSKDGWGYLAVDEIEQWALDRP